MKLNLYLGSFISHIFDFLIIADFQDGWSHANAKVWSKYVNRNQMLSALFCAKKILENFKKLDYLGFFKGRFGSAWSGIAADSEYVFTFSLYMVLTPIKTTDLYGLTLQIVTAGNFILLLFMNCIFTETGLFINCTVLIVNWKHIQAAMANKANDQKILCGIKNYFKRVYDLMKLLLNDLYFCNKTTRICVLLYQQNLSWLTKTVLTFWSDSL